MRAGRAIAAMILVGCTTHAGPSRTVAEERIVDPPCERLPEARPPGSVLRIGRVDGESLEYVLDVALVADAPCPTRPTLDDPTCVHLTDEAMDYVWRGLVEIEPHRIALERHGECIHCGGPWLAVDWPGGSCERGMDHFHDVAERSRDRFDRAVHLLEAAAAAGGVEAKAPPR